MICRAAALFGDQHATESVSYTKCGQSVHDDCTRVAQEAAHLIVIDMLQGLLPCKGCQVKEAFNISSLSQQSVSEPAVSLWVCSQSLGLQSIHVHAEQHYWCAVPSAGNVDWLCGQICCLHSMPR